ncbi:hypothetical protein [Micromonospora sp. NPDC047074]|uniref:hypothetical protein n=1 Tax=Micromonospora sp. NPDC047074 TaxID=3154339 RepID=UPI0033E77396
MSGAPGYPPPVSGAPGYPPGYPMGAPQMVAPPKKNRTVLIVVAVVAALALLCCVGGIIAIVAGANKATDDLANALPTPGITHVPPGGTTPGSDEDNYYNLKPGATLVVSDSRGTIEITVTRFTTEAKGCRAYAPDPSKGMYLIAHVTATVTKGTSSINPFYFEWVAENSPPVNGLTSSLSGCGELLGSGSNMGEGSKRAGTVVFNVADQNGTLQYRHQFKAVGSWKP